VTGHDVEAVPPLPQRGKLASGWVMDLMRVVLMRGAASPDGWSRVTAAPKLAPGLPGR